MTDSAYRALTRLHDQYHGAGFTVLAFPCNQFGAQEPGTEAEIKKLVRGTYGAKFPLFSKVAVKGKSIHPVWAMLLQAFPGPVPWNFMGRFLVNRHGIPVHRFDRGDDWTVVEDEVKKLLATSNSRL
eukprot:NODE_7658_length_752_cov_5.379968_g7409_i0.p1 GENE.NODE_7658_length_752_cov_5.379968_g7409_i0~~NODE_7658_length_752_cov_5.379968_g7409_i0.p1  ORF type:complete len:127 (-),score=20.63 NODE_7658_length_752_cov_5.379968_g7409_i0:230-610(-)